MRHEKIASHSRERGIHPPSRRETRRAVTRYAIALGGLMVLDQAITDPAVHYYIHNYHMWDFLLDFLLDHT